MKYIHYSLFLLILLASCQNENRKTEKITALSPKTPPKEQKDSINIPRFQYDSSQWTQITDLDASISLDIRYATTNNFTKQVIYDCPACFMRPEMAESLVQVHQQLKARGYRGLKLFDCYRPRQYQQKLWDIVPNPKYVSRPSKGSMHGRGKAVDLTIINKEGEELDMGTEFDFFGKEAASNYPFKDSIILNNRKLLQEVMKEQGFYPISSEWWHFYYKGKGYPLSDWVWDCER